MRLATITRNGAELAGIVTPKGVFPIAALNAAKGAAWSTDMLSLIQKGEVPGLTAWYNAGGDRKSTRLNSSH